MIVRQLSFLLLTLYLKIWLDNQLLQLEEREGLKAKMIELKFAMKQWNIVEIKYTSVLFCRKNFLLQKKKNDLLTSWLSITKKNSMLYCSCFVFVDKKKILVYSLHFIASIIIALNESLTRVVMYIYSVKSPLSWLWAVVFNSGRWCCPVIVKSGHRWVKTLH